MTTHKVEAEAKPVPAMPATSGPGFGVIQQPPQVTEPTHEVKELSKLVELEHRVAKLETHFFVLRYKHRGAPKSLEFQNKDLESAILRGRQHCQTQGYKFIYVEPVYLDLDILDKRMEDNRRRDDAGESTVATV